MFSNLHDRLSLDEHLLEGSDVLLQVLHSHHVNSINEKSMYEKCTLLPPPEVIAFVSSDTS